MDQLKEYLHMKDGDGELSYSQNSFAQKQALLMNQNALDSAIQSLLSKEQGLITEATDVLSIADLGCGVGPSPLAFIKLVVESVKKACKQMNSDSTTNESHQKPKLQIYMNDLPSNDFNLLFRNLLNSEVFKTNADGVPTCFLMGAPGCYYHILFPRNTLHFVHSNYALQWFSQTPTVLNGEEGAPINKGNFYISETSSKDVAKAYIAQFEKDFTQFLKCHSQEIVPKGYMLLAQRGRPSMSNSLTWQPWELKIFTKALISLKSEGLIKEEKLDSFNFPYYCACEEELESVVRKEGSFSIETTYTVAHHVAHEIKDKEKRSKIIACLIRAFSESLIVRHFEEEIVGPLYDKLAYYALQHLDHGHLAQLHTVTILLRKV